MREQMSNHRLTVSLAICTLLLLLLSLHAAQGQNYFQYNVQIKSDGSAVWNITQFSNVNATVETFDIFQQKIFDLVDSAASITHREMTVDENSLQINTTISSESKTTEYTFVWQNFSIVRASQVSFGDVFQVNNFFGQLYDDAALQLNYPPEFTVKSVSPVPYERQDSADMMMWSRTQDLVTNRVSIVLTSDSQTGNGTSNGWQFYAIVVAVIVVGAFLSLVGFFMLKRRKNNASSATTIESPIMSEEDKVLKLLKSFGGSMRQSEITEQSRFSKAKTSQLLAALEKSGSITRYKNGRDKIVTLKERGKSE
jgi:uncharacterized membrane protein